MTVTRVNLVCHCGHSDSHNCRADWGDGKYLQPSAPGRLTVGTITDPVLHRLYDERDMYARDWAAAEKRTEQAEGAVERVLAFVARLDDMADTTISTDDRQLYRALAADLRAALDEPVEPSP